MLKNSEGNRDDVWNFLSRAGGRYCFILVRDKNRKSSEKRFKEN